MKKNDSIQEIGRQFMQAERVLLFPHIQVDGDGLGSATALCLALRKAGKQAAVLIEDDIPENLGFLRQDCCTEDAEAVGTPDVCACIDCGETSRFPGRAQTFARGRVTVCIDHHGTSAPFADYNYIDGSRAATAEIIYELINEMGIPLDKAIGEAIYAGICTDTGNFQYANTTCESHLIAARLFQAGIDHNRVAVEIYQSNRLERVRLSGRILDTLQIFAGGQAAMAWTDRHMLAETGARLEDAEGSVEMLRNIRGVEVAAFLKEKEPKVIRVSLRAKSRGDVAGIAARFGGGGHVKAAGCTLYTDMQDACRQMQAAIEEQLAGRE